MFGEIFIVIGITLISATAEKVLESNGKEKEANFLGIVTRGGLAIMALKEINTVVKEVTKDFL
jgi:hypothetical protein